mgnify:CR=1 FL=1
MASPRAFPYVPTLLSDYVADRRTIWATCRNGLCNHAAELDLPALIARHGDVALDAVVAKLKCSRCGGPAGITIHAG